jgi:hypothetical protein
LLCPNEQLAQYYYDKGDFESKKSVRNCFKRDPQNSPLFLRSIDCLQQLQQFETKALQLGFDKYQQEPFWWNYNLSLQKKTK